MILTEPENPSTAVRRIIPIIQASQHTIVIYITNLMGRGKKVQCQK